MSGKSMSDSRVKAFAFRSLTERLFRGRNFVSLLFVGVLMALMPSTASAQVLYGTLVGNVTDSTGAVIIGATVVATDTGTNISKTTTTDGSGTFRISDLSAGTYKVSISAKAFNKVVSTPIVIVVEYRRALRLPASPGDSGADCHGDRRPS